MIIETIKPINHDIQLSFGASDIKRTVIKQNSNHTHILRITLYDTENKLLIDEGWMSEGWKIEISVKKPDNTFIVNADNIAIVDNTIHVTMTQQMLAAPGTQQCELLIYKQDGTCYFSDTFLLYIEPNVIFGSDLESTNEYDSIVDTLNTIKDYEKEAEHGKNHIQDVASEADHMLENLGETLVSAVEILSETEPAEPITGSFWLKEY